MPKSTLWKIRKLSQTVLSSRCTAFSRTRCTWGARIWCSTRSSVCINFRYYLNTPNKITEVRRLAWPGINITDSDFG